MSQSDYIKTPQVYAAIVGVIRDMSIDGIAKDRKNTAQSYNFRGIDDVYNALSPALAKNNLCMLPRVKSRTMTEGATKSGGTLFYVVCEVDFDLVCSLDGSIHTITSIGEAMDSADKATNKAMSAAYKYAAMQAFAIPTEGTNDADAHTPEPAPRGGGWQGNQRQEAPAWQGRQEAPQRVSAPAPAPAPAPVAKWTDGARKAFCGDLDKIGVSYENCAAYCESLGRPRPSLMAPEQRSVLLAALLGAGRARFDAFLAAPVEVANDHR